MFCKEGPALPSLADTDRLPNKRAGNTGGGIAHRARLELESKTGRKVVTGENYLPPSKSKKGLKA